MTYLSLVGLLALSGALDADASYKEGMLLFEDFDYPAAIERFEKALADESRSDDERAKLHMLIGVSQAELTNTGAASESFTRALEIDADAKLPVLTSPKTQALFEEARAKLPAKAAAPEAAISTEVAAPADGDPAAPETTAEGMSVGVLGVSSLVAAGVGAVAITTGLATFGWGWLAIDEANRQTFQSDGARIEAQAVTLQVVGQVLAATGVVVALGAAGLGAASLALE